MSLKLGGALRATRTADPSAAPDIVSRIATAMDATDVVVYLIDFGQTTLEPIPDRNSHADLPRSEDVSTTMAGRAFSGRCTVTAPRPDGVRVWVPVIEGSDRTGVVALTVPDAGNDILEACEELGILCGFLIATRTRTTDLYNLYRRRRALSLAASIQWDLLPPLVLKTTRLTVACLLEPAYEAGGDSFDYALNNATFDLALFDAMGHELTAALIASLAVGSYRHDRRESRSLEYMHQNLDAAIAKQFPDAYATGLLARVDLDSGVLTWTNAAHPPPLLIRGGQVVRALELRPTLPWGIASMGQSTEVSLASETLEPGDCVLLYTDGVTEGRMPGGERFGVERIGDLIGQHASNQLEPEEIIRRVSIAVMAHQADRLADDATLVLFQWNGPPPQG